MLLFMTCFISIYHSLINEYLFWKRKNTSRNPQVQKEHDTKLVHPYEEDHQLEN